MTVLFGRWKVRRSDGFMFGLGFNVWPRWMDRSGRYVDAWLGPWFVEDTRRFEKGAQ